VNALNPAEVDSLTRLVRMAIKEDLDRAGDRTTRAIIPNDTSGRAVFVARSDGTVAGLPVVHHVFAWTKLVTAKEQFQPLVQDGASVKRGDHLAVVAGNTWKLLAAERVALNFIQHLSGIATLTRAYVDAVAEFSCRILDTRKTTPGWRLLEKYAVRCGGGHNHRIGLYDGILIKDNHLAALGGGVEAVRTAIDLSRKAAPAGVFVEIEVESLDQMDAALAGKPDIILLDNMPLHMMREAVKRRKAVAPGVLLEASGGVNLQTVRAIAETGVDRISIGALTHSAPALDIALDYGG
jgi:nicotinate-nucleotide pyrophosphorylase (carboxylating)